MLMTQTSLQGWKNYKEASGTGETRGQMVRRWRPVQRKEERGCLLLLDKLRTRLA